MFHIDKLHRRFTRRARGEKEESLRERRGASFPELSELSRVPASQEPARFELLDQRQLESSADNPDPPTSKSAGDEPARGLRTNPPARADGSGHSPFVRAPLVEGL